MYQYWPSGAGPLLQKAFNLQLHYTYTYKSSLPYCVSLVCKMLDITQSITQKIQLYQLHYSFSSAPKTSSST